MRWLILNFKKKLKVKILNVISSSEFLSNLYYLNKKQFSREHQKVLKGKENYLRKIESNDSSYMLRRNIHRIEKGLIMRPRRERFALDYIGKTVNCYCAMTLKYSDGHNIDKEELNWATDVLGEYFKVVKSNEKIERLRDKYNSAKINLKESSKDLSIPYNRLNVFSDISYQQLLRLASYRRSIRWYQKKKVPREKIDKAINIANLSPSACNRQPYKFRVFDDEMKVRNLSKLPMGTGGFADNIPVIVAVVGNLSAYEHERDRHLIYIDSSLAVMSFLYGLEVQGLSSCILNWPDVKEKDEKIEDYLGLNMDEKVIMLIAVGYPDYTGKVAFSKKKDLEMIRSYN
jgi:nitroreductase